MTKKETILKQLKDLETNIIGFTFGASFNGTRTEELECDNIIKLSLQNIIDSLSYYEDEPRDEGESCGFDEIDNTL